MGVGEVEKLHVLRRDGLDQSRTRRYICSVSDIPE